ncbi:MAG TPA: glutamine-hydrolyzing GMP synthase, partial [Spirochaetaceae bacterium]|nr:glutamine-hydrolyzing GMP synthase [Spirochaetaceae bacterium]
MDKILILDYGSQYTQLIGRRVRELGVYSEILPGEAALDAKTLQDCSGIILSGSPYSAYEEGAPAPHESLYASALPMLGICYGIQRMMLDSGGTVERLPEREYGRKPVSLLEKGLANPLFSGVGREFSSWMSHGDSILKVASGWKILAESEGGIPAALAHETMPRWGVQFHPEVSHCEFGTKILENFVIGICRAGQGWSMKAYLERETEKLRERAGASPVLLLISGGVDSTVAGAFLLKALDPGQVYLLYIDTGLMRAAESEEVMKNLASLGARHLHKVDAEAEFL